MTHKPVAGWVATGDGSAMAGEAAAAAAMQAAPIGSPIGAVPLPQAAPPASGIAVTVRPCTPSPWVLTTNPKAASVVALGVPSPVGIGAGFKVTVPPLWVMVPPTSVIGITDGW